MSPAANQRAESSDRAPVVDAVTLTVIEKGLQQVCSEMDLVHEKTSFSPVISEAFDRSNGIYHVVDGRMIAQGALGLPIFLGQMAVTTNSVINMRSDMEDGDVILVNDPYLGGSHLMDVKMVRPFFYRGKLWCYLSNVGHWPDTGGMVPGGFNSTATEIHQEGLRIPPVKLIRRGKMDSDLLDIVLANVRVANERIGDIKAQVAALAAGAKRLTALIDRYGQDVVDAAVTELEVRSERMMRAYISTIPDGVYKAVAYMDSDGVVNEPLDVCVKITVLGSDMTVDFDGSSPPCAGPINTVWATTLSAVYVGMKHIFPDVAMSSGCFKPIHVIKPHGTFLYAEYPKPVAGCGAEVSQRIVEAMFMALSQAIPDRVFGPPAGTSGNLSLGGFDPASNENYIMYNFSGGGYGGWWAGDGLSNGCSTIGISKNQPVEILEQRYPLLFEHYSLHEGSAGPGKFRGGFGVSYKLRLLRGTGKVSFMMEHGRSGPPGILGGEPGAPNKIQIGRGGRTIVPEHLSKGEGYVLAPGDWIEVRTPGGGGYRPAAERDPALSERDLRRGYFAAGQN